MTTETVAALDCGTNTLRLLIATTDPAGHLIEVTRQLRFARLGQDVDATGRFAAEAMERGWAVIEEYLPLMRQAGCTKGRFVATSAARDASNREVFFEGVQSRLGFAAELVSGDEEAQLSFVGALQGGRLSGEPVLVMDSGGGSTELVRGTASGGIAGDTSLDIGSRRVRERYLHSDPPTADQVAQARAEVNRMLDDCPIALGDVATFIGVAGTVTTMMAVHLGLRQYERERVHGASMTTAEVVELSQRLLDMTADEVLALGPVAPERAKVLGAGALVVAEISKRVPVKLQASESDILDGIVLSILRDGRGHPFVR